jgi:hypothetical protein
MSDEKKSQESKPIKQGDLDKISGGYEMGPTPTPVPPKAGPNPSPVPHKMPTTPGGVKPD